MKKQYCSEVDCMAAMMETWKIWRNNIVNYTVKVMLERMQTMNC